MELRDKVVVVTGGARGIGAALCRRFVREGARAVFVADLLLEEAEALARALGPAAVAARCDVAKDEDLRGLVEAALAAHGRIDLFCSNAGIAVGGGPEAPDADWQRAWEVNLLAHVRAARAVLPSMLARGEGYLLQTASAAGLLTSLAAAPYAVTKHGAVAFAEWMAITYGARGIRVSCLCPQGVNTHMIADHLAEPGTQAVLAAGKVLEPDDVAEVVVRGLAAETFLLLPHPEVAQYEATRATDRPRWLGAMRKLWGKLQGSGR